MNNLCHIQNLNREYKIKEKKNKYETNDSLTKQRENIVQVQFISIHRLRFIIHSMNKRNNILFTYPIKPNQAKQIELMVIITERDFFILEKNAHTQLENAEQ